MPPFDPTAYGPAFAAVFADRPLAPLDAGAPNLAIRPLLQAWKVETAFAPATVRVADMGRACLAGLWLLHGFLDESHKISQEIETPTGSYWHALMHRREPDFGNSAYWFRRVRAHPIFDALCGDAAELARTAAESEARFLTTQSNWDPFGFGDLCEASLRGTSQCAALCRAIQQREWELLFDYSYRQAIDG